MKKKQNNVTFSIETWRNQNTFENNDHETNGSTINVISDGGS